GEPVADRWLVLGQVIEDDERVRAQRTWLLGETSGRAALVLQFAVGEAPFPALFGPGTRFEGALAFWRSAWPQRALVKERRADAGQVTGLPDLPGTDSIESFLSSVADALARQPWLDRFPCALRAVI